MTKTTKRPRRTTKKAKARARKVAAKRPPKIQTRERLRSLLAAEPGITNAEAGRQLGVSRERVRQLIEADVSLSEAVAAPLAHRLASKPDHELLRMGITRAGVTVAVFAMDYLARDVTQVNDWLSPDQPAGLPLAVRSRLVRWLADTSWPRLQERHAG